ncbi:hypothetical protein ElyMa_004181900 [Elysia marginata]|uniref:Uncharacterized protein n=1 Tax=Elysia marginata TaxID=1093978 RepID=A0AAV4GMW0_9GAST|nr:hypothetical protein ElyMa_004181900 [Elysia marginata]
MNRNQTRGVTKYFRIEREGQRSSQARSLYLLCRPGRSARAVWFGGLQFSTFALPLPVRDFHSSYLVQHIETDRPPPAAWQESGSGKQLVFVFAYRDRSRVW